MRVGRSLRLLAALAAMAAGSLSCRGSAALGWPPAAAVDAASVDSAAALLRAEMTRAGIPGISVAVWRGDTLRWAAGFGFADLEHRIPLTPRTKMRIGSISKSLTAASLMRLHERGRIDLDAPVTRYVPTFPAKRWPVTLRQLAGHLGGIRHYDGDEMLSREPYATVRAGLAVFERDTLLFEPGTRYTYSSYGFNLLSSAIEGAAGRPFLQVMRDEVFFPLALGETTAEFPDSLIPDRARFYEVSDSGRLTVNAPYVDNSLKWAGGGFLSTPTDLVRFGAALLRPGYLRSESIAAMWTAQRTRAGESTGYGIGWRVREHEGRREVAHGGSSVGANAYLLIRPDERIVVAVLSNAPSRFVGSGEAARRIAMLFAR